jgi:hypothetical protein
MMNGLRQHQLRQVNNLSIPEFLSLQFYQFLQYKAPLSAFRNWFFANPVSLREEDIVYDIKLLMTEYDHGDWTDEEMYDKLKELMPTAPQIKPSIPRAHDLLKNREEQVHVNET